MAEHRTLSFMNRVVGWFNTVTAKFGINGPDLARRAVKTFFQAGLAVVTLDTFDVFSITDWKAAAVAGAAAAWSLIQNKVVIPVWDKTVTARREALIDPHAH